MTTPSGTIGLSDVNVEIGYPYNRSITMNDAVVRTLAGAGGSGTSISMSSLRNKNYRVSVPLTIAGNVNHYNVHTYATTYPTYIAGKSDITVTINPGVVVGSPSTSYYAFYVPNALNPGDTVTITNNGTIRGQGGNGGPGGALSYPPTTSLGTPGYVGGNAMYVSRPITLRNNGNIWAGGGGGGGGDGRAGKSGSKSTFSAGGGGGGGGRGHATSYGGTGGSAPATYPIPGYPGGNGYSGGAGAGGAGGYTEYVAPFTRYPGGNGGGFGASGAGAPVVGRPGGLSGYCIVGNGYISYLATGSRLGRFA